MTRDFLVKRATQLAIALADEGLPSVDAVAVLAMAVGIVVEGSTYDEREPRRDVEPIFSAAFGAARDVFAAIRAGRDGKPA
jgi:hypothetical protein